MESNLAALPLFKRKQNAIINVSLVGVWNECAVPFSGTENKEENKEEEEEEEEEMNFVRKVFLACSAEKMPTTQRNNHAFSLGRG